MITIVGPTAPYKGGIAQHTTELAHRLLECGKETRIETWRRQYPRRLYPGSSQLASGDHRDFPNVVRKLSWNNPLSWILLGCRLRRAKGDFLFVGVTPFQYPIYVVVLLCAGRSARQRSALIAHNVVPHESSRFDRFFTRTLFQLVATVLTHSEHEQEQAQRFGADAGSALLPFHFETAVSEAKASRERGLLAFIGFVRPYKGLDLLLEAIAYSESSLRLETLGEFWSDAEYFRDLAVTLGIADRCCFRDHYASSSEIIDLMDRADALVMPYRAATSSQLPRVAFTRGTPVVVTNVGDLPRQVRHGVDGLVCEPTSTALSFALRVIADNDQARRLRSAVEPPDVDAEWDDYLNELHRLLQAGD